QRATTPVTVGDSNQVKDFNLAVETTCDAAGYTSSDSAPVLSEEFESGETPAGWSVVNATPNGGWGFTDPGNHRNRTGGTGMYAIADTDYNGPGKTMDTALITPAIDLSAVPAPVLQFNSDYRAKAFGGFADVDVSVDGGTTWTNVAHRTSTRVGPRLEEISLPGAAGKSDVRIRFHYKATPWAFWWEVDNVSIVNRPCDPVPGGLVVGRVLDGNTATGLNRATVTSVDKPAEKAETGPTPDDASLGDGFYWMFSTLTGNHPFTGAKRKYESATSAVGVTADQATRADFTLKAGRLTITPPSVASSLTLGQSKTVQTTIRNDGTAPATVELPERRGGFEILGQPGAPLQNIRVDGGGVSPAWQPDSQPGEVLEPSPSAPPWTTTANYPVPVMDNAVAAYDGLVYSIGGTSTVAFDKLTNSYVYDPATNVWTRIADLPAGLAKPAAAFVGGKLFVFGGWDLAGNPSAKVFAYDPDTEVWETRASTNPAPTAAPGIGVVDGQIYLVGGCVNNNCIQSNTTVRYNPGTDTFTTVAGYPSRVAWQGCGGIDDTLYCAGGLGPTTLKSTYAYSPSSNTWTQKADLPVDVWGAGADTANGLLLLSAGAINNSTMVTNQGWAYDPAADSWSALPNANHARYRAGAACGFVKVGGASGGANMTADSELLPGFDQCDTSADVPWLSASPTSPTSPTLQPGQSITVNVTLDATSAGVQQPGDYTAQLAVKSDTPYAVAPIDVTMTVHPPKDWGKATGVITGIDCKGNSTTLRGATVRINGKKGWTYTLKTDADGRYAIWAPKDNPAAINAARDGWEPQLRMVNLKAGETTTTDFALRPDTAC
ncbi:kelch repeat-containing protein, partial [Micromonospora sp. NPDC050200]|uniref:Kelch repeat-containing protein n=1 Tax=Micromonospora sp. NPDC050200 TaxID=3155664 RepID=UPI0033FEFA54